MRISRIYLAVAGAFFALHSSGALAALEWTTAQNIWRIEYDGASEDLFFRRSSTWSASTCPSVVWIRVLPTVTGRKQVFALATAAQMAGKSVTFYGECDSGGTFFNAAYIRVE